MRRHPMLKIHALEVRHPGLCDKVHLMFEGLWPARDVKHMIQTHYGERLSQRTVERYKSLHWRAQRECVQQMHEAIAAAGLRKFGIMNSEIRKSASRRASVWANQPMARWPHAPIPDGPYPKGGQVP